MTNAPQMIGKYRIIASLASGSQGTVYRAHDPTLERDVALKVLHPHLATPEFIARFRREAQIVASISHPNIAGISEIGEHNGAHFIAIEYVPHSVSELIGRGPMDITLAASIAHQTALALEAARVSRRGVTHHDVKPDNLLLTSLDAGGVVKLIDFGIAHAQGMATMTQAGSQWGTPFYMPPEQWEGERGDTRSDVYSLGVVMYQMLAGHVPFDSDAENALARQKAIADRHLETDPVPLRSVRADVPEALEALVAKCMAKSPDERCQTPGELAGALADIFSLAEPSATVAPSRPPVRISPEPPRRAAPRPPRPPRPARQLPPIFDRLPANLRNRMPLLAAGGAGALLAIVALVIMASRPGDDPPLPPRVVVVPAAGIPTATPAATPHPAILSLESIISNSAAQPTRAPTRTPAPRAATPTPTPAVSAADFIRAALAQLSATPTRTPAPTRTPPPRAVPVPTRAPISTPKPTAPPTPDNPNAMADLSPVMDSFAWSPTNPSVGDKVTFTVAIQNRGQRNAEASLLVYSIDGMEGAEIGTVDIPPIAPGDSVEATFDWRAEAGHHNVALEVDAENHVRERSEGNNAVAQGLIYYGTQLADLRVVSIEWEPENPALGEPVTFTATVSNAGTGRAAASELYLQVGDEDGVSESLPSIPPSGTASADFKWTARTGSHKIVALADLNKTVSEMNEYDNELAKPYEATVFVDLFVEDITWTPENPSVGDSVTFSATVGNRGSLDAGESKVLLEDAGGADIGAAVLPRVPAGGSGVVEFVWTATQGAVNLIAVANGDKALRETDYDNNRAEKHYNATALPELVVDGIAWSPENPALGEETTVTLTVKNEGEGRASAASVRYSVEDSEVSGILDLPDLDAGASADLTFTWTAEKGGHYFSAHVNPDESVIETSYRNNDFTVLYDNTRQANLAVDSAAWSPENPSVGAEVTFSAAVRNKGDADAPAFTIEIRDESAGKWHKRFELPYGLAAGASAVATFAWTAEVGARDFAVRADSENKVNESDESDNSHRITYRNTVAADLFVRDIRWNPATPSLGQDVPITVIVANKGKDGAGASSVNFIITGSDGYRSEMNANLPAIAAGDSAQAVFTWSARLGRFKMTASADAKQQVPEIDENDNTLVNNYNDTVQVDLVVDRLEVITNNPTAGSEVEIRALIRNDGEGDAGRFRVSLAVNGVVLDSDRINWLLSGEDEWARFSVTWKYTGQVAFTVVADYEGDIPEKSESNNRFEARETF